MSVCLDAFALLAWLQNEPGANEVESESLGAVIERRSSACWFTARGLLFLHFVRKQKKQGKNPAYPVNPV